VVEVLWIHPAVIKNKACLGFSEIVEPKNRQKPTFFVAISQKTEHEGGTSAKKNNYLNKWYLQ